MRRLRPSTHLVLSAALLISCSGSAPTLPEVALPSFDTAAIQRLVDDAIEEVGQLADSAAADLPAGLASLLDQHGVTLPPLPSNAAEICDALSTPGVSTVAGAGLTELLQSLVAGGEAGLVIGLVVTVVLKTCPVWTPHLETAIDQVL